MKRLVSPFRDIPLSNEYHTVEDSTEVPVSVPSDVFHSPVKVPRVALRPWFRVTPERPGCIDHFVCSTHHGIHHLANQGTTREFTDGNAEVKEHNIKMLQRMVNTIICFLIV